MAWCLSPSLATLSSFPDGVASRRHLSVFPTSFWPSEPGAYDLTQQIGNGSSASVYQAYCRQVQATVAVKRLNLDAPCDLASLTREAALMRRFQHQHVLRLYTSFVVGRELWMVMQLMDLGSVRSIMRRAFPQGLDEVMIATIIKSTLQALNFIHKNGGIHRDVKADNILIDSQGEVRLADFGVASDHHSNGISVILKRVLSNDDVSARGGGSNRPDEVEGRKTDCSRQQQQRQDSSTSSTSSTGASLPSALQKLRANTFVGTPCWMAPEVMQQLEEGYTNAADIWSLGITLIELATGKPPLARCNPVRVLLDTLNRPPPSLPDDFGSRRFSKAFRTVVAACLQKDASKRPSAAELLQHRFFRAARDASYLSSTVSAALLRAQQAPGAIAADLTCAGAAAPARAASTPAAVGLGSLARPHTSCSLSMQAGSSRKVQSEPFMVRLKSALGLGLAGPAGAQRGSFLGRQGGGSSSRFTTAAGSHSSDACSRQKSKWQFTTAAAAAVGLGLKPKSPLLVAPTPQAEAAGAADAKPQASVSASSAFAPLSRAGSRGVKLLPAAGDDGAGQQWSLHAQ